VGLDTLNLAPKHRDRHRSERGDTDREDGAEPRRAADVWAKLSRFGKGTLRLLLNWGIIAVAITTVLVIRHRAEVRARAPLPPPAVQLPPADAAAWQAFPRYHGAVPVLLYHGIASGGGQPHLFAQQMLALRTAGFHAITLAQYISFASGHHGGLPSKPILLTFDGGRLDTYRAVTDILRKYGFHATMFTFAGWPPSGSAADLTWGELQSMQQSGIWSVQENGGSPDDAIYHPAVRSNILWGARQFAGQLPGFKTLAFAVPYASYGAPLTLAAQIALPPQMLPWLKQHFSVVFGGDYLTRGINQPHKPASRFSHELSYRISIDSRTSLAALDCRLKDWVTHKPVWKEWRCLRLDAGAPGTGPAPGTKPTPGRDAAHRHSPRRTSAR
jgi:polysaccharide deacetylase